MKVACPKCHKEFPVPSDIISRGVVRVACASCGFGFVIRLGDPKAAKPKRAPAAPVKIEGLKSSNRDTSVAGEIGTHQERIVNSGTQTSIKLDPGLLAELNRAASKAKPQIIIAATKTRAGDITEPEIAPPFSPAAADTRPSPPASVEEPCAPALLETMPVPRPASADVPPLASGGEALAEDPAPSEQAEEDLTAEAREDLGEERAEQAGPAPSDTFESYRSPDSIAPPPELVPMAPMVSMAPMPPLAPPVAHPAYPAYPPSAAGYPPPYAYAAPGALDSSLEVYALPEPTTGKSTKVLGVLMTLVIITSSLLFLYVLMQNNWSFDLANFGAMVERSFGGQPKRETNRQLRGLLLSEHLVEESTLASEARVLTVKGALKNNDTLPRRYVFVRATLEDNHGRTITSAEAPAGNIFSAEELVGMTAAQLNARITPAGQDGKNLRFLPGDSMAFMVVILKLPANYSRRKHRVLVEVSKAQFLEEE